ncbi:MAG: hypothetical protein KBD76_15985 [Bacteriovorax sp.]|nr:hypothetical protein [Bacteriovorax sp.]
MKLIYLFLFVSLNINAQANVANPVLFIMGIEKNVCQFSFQFLETGITEKWFSLPECLSSNNDLIFDYDNHRAFFAQKGKYWTVDLKKESTPKFLTESHPISSIEGQLSSKIWIDQDSGNLNMAHLITKPLDLNPELEKSWIKKNFPKLAQSWVPTKRPKDDGGAVIAVLELKDNKWKELTIKQGSTDVYGGEFFPINQLTTKAKKNVETLNDLVMMGNYHVLKENPQFSKKASTWIKKTFPPDEETGQGSMDYISMGENDGFLVGKAIGDTYHWVMPIYYCKGELSKRCETHEELYLVKSNQIAVSTVPNYALISDEYKGTSAELFTKGSKKSISHFNTEAVVTWIRLPW